MRIFGSIVICVIAVAGVGICLVTASSQTDLSDLTPVAQPPGSPPALSWASLLRHRRLIADAGGAPHTGIEARALGYAMDADRPLNDGEPVSTLCCFPTRATYCIPPTVSATR